MLFEDNSKKEVLGTANLSVEGENDNGMAKLSFGGEISNIQQQNRQRLNSEIDSVQQQNDQNHKYVIYVLPTKNTPLSGMQLIRWRLARERWVIP